MTPDSQETEVDTLKIKRPAADKLREVCRTWKEKRPGSITQSEAIEMMAAYYLAHELKAERSDG